MNNKKPSIDGFIPRRPGSQIGELHNIADTDKLVKPIDRSLHTGSNVQQTLGVPRQGKIMGQGGDLEESLRQIDDEPDKKRDKKQKRRLKDGRLQHPRKKTWRIIKWSLIVLVIIGALIGGYVVLKAVLAGNSVFQGSIFDIVKNEPLKEDENGRSNFLIFGTAEDDEGGEHGGRNLTDTIMILSVDQDQKNAYMINLPRDLWVEYDERCWVGDRGRINAVYTCVSDDGKDEAAGAKALQDKAGEVLGLDIQYYIHLNFTAVVEAVDAVDGVDVTIESEDPRGILDRNFDWKCRYQCYYVNYKNGEVAHLDGEHALALARARNAADGYGLPGGNFDREKNQQKILKALREKAVSVGTLTNLGAVTGLIDALGNNLRTNINTNEVRTLMALGNDISSENIISLSLVNDDEPLVRTDNINGQSIVRPVAGFNNFAAIQEYVQKNLTSDPVVREGPHVTVLNATSTVGVAKIEGDKLKEFGFEIDQLGNTAAGNYARIEIYQINAEKIASAAKLKEIYGVEIKTTAPPVSVVGESDFLIIVGSV